jgi:hypothetical protein
MTLVRKLEAPSSQNLLLMKREACVKQYITLAATLALFLVVPNNNSKKTIVVHNVNLLMELHDTIENSRGKPDYAFSNKSDERLYKGLKELERCRGCFFYG